MDNDIVQAKEQLNYEVVDKLTQITDKLEEVVKLVEDVDRCSPNRTTTLYKALYAVNSVICSYNGLN